MKSAVLSIVRNEADIIEVFVRYHIQKFDHVFIVDHLSKDGTSDILNQLVQEGLPLTVQKSDVPYHAQGHLMTSLLKEVRSKHKISVVMPIDADEFVVGDIRKAAYDLPSNVPCTVSALWYNYAPTALENLHPLKDICYRNKQVNPIQHKTLIPGPLIDHNVHVLEGCHELYFGEKMVQMIVSEHLHLAHFPIRSAIQFMKKALVGWTAKLANPANQGNKPEWSHWKMFFDKAKKGELSLLELQSLALGYTVDHHSDSSDLIYDPVSYSETDIKYPFDDKYQPLEALADAAEMMAYQLGLSLAGV